MPAGRVRHGIDDGQTGRGHNRPFLNPRDGVLATRDVQGRRQVAHIGLPRREPEHIYMMRDPQHGRNNRILAQPRRGGDMGKVRGKVTVKTDRNLPMGGRGIAGFHRGLDQRLKLRDKLVTCHHQRVIIHQQRAIGRQCLADTRNRRLFNAVTERDDPAVEFAFDYGAELDRKRGIAAGQVLYFGCRHSCQNENIVSCIGLG